MKPPASKGSALHNVTLAGLLLCALVAFAWWKWIYIDPRGPVSVCRVCSAERGQSTIYLHGHRLGSWYTEARASDATHNYFDRYLAYPHTHVWESRNLGLTRMALLLVAASGIREPEGRRRYFESMVQPTSDEHRFHVYQTWLQIARQIPIQTKGLWGPNPIWAPEMEGITIPDYVRAGGLMPLPTSNGSGQTTPPSP